MKKHPKAKEDKRNRPLNYVETVGLENAIWPHLYWTTEMCETYVRSIDERRQERKASDSEEDSAEDTSDSDGDISTSDEDEDRAVDEARRRQSLKNSFQAKV